MARAMAEATRSAARNLSSSEAEPVSPAPAAPNVTPRDPDHAPSAPAQPPLPAMKPPPFVPRTQRYVLNRIISHEIADGSEPDYPAGLTLYRVRWYGHGPWDDTWEPIAHRPRSHVQRYYKKRKLPLPADIGDAMLG